MLRRALLAVPLLAALALAGCTGGGGDGLEPVDVPELEATATTGVIRAVVVDEAIRPIAGARVTVTQGGAEVQAGETDETGFAGFSGLPPGTYFLLVHKLGYTDSQQSAEVLAGVPDPPVVKVLLVFDAEALPFVLAFKFDGFLECSAFVGNWCFIANFYPCVVMQAAGQPCTGNLTNDNSYFRIDAPLRELQRVPDWLQLEMVWESTQALGAEMNARIDFISDPSGFQYDNSTESTGPSPLLVAMTPEELQENDIGTDRLIAIETFHGGATAAAVEQRFSDFVHVFYGYQPPEGWRFSAEGTVPQPE